jgi:hypothetical protein
MRPVAEPNRSDAEKLAWVREDLQKALDDLKAGRVIDGKDVFALLKSRIDQRRRPGAAGTH